jgi:predicted N-formylglutamate amidohydrolase
MARTLARRFRAPLVAATVSRLLVDLNRSLGHPQLFSEVMHGTTGPRRAAAIDQYYLPYRRRVEKIVGSRVAGGRRVVHISAHSFTPELNGEVRDADVGLLYDPGRHEEAQLCAKWKSALSSRAPWLRVRRNYPYRGTGDGLAAHLRRSMPRGAYVGIELEINQGIVHAGRRQLAELCAVLCDALRAAALP